MIGNTIKKALSTVMGKNRTSKAVCVLGSGRCGTSMATRAINFIGVDLGTQFVKRDHTNPKGFWEHKKIVDIHKKIKAELGKRPFPPGWERQTSIQPYKKELKALLTDQFLNKELWGWKDPRTCESIALWRDILQELNVSAHYLIMVRNPIDVAASYKEAYNRQENSALRQWQMRTLLSLKGTNGEKRMIVDYDDFLNDSLGTIHHIAKTFDLPWPEDEAGLKDELDSFIDPGLQHSRTTLEALMNQEGIDEDIKQLYQLCIKGARSQPYLQSEQFASQIEALSQSF